MVYTIKSGKLTAKINSYGAELTSVVGEDGFDYIWQCPGEGFWADHSPVLFPHCGRILNSTYTYDGKSYDMGTHGFAKEKDFSLVSISEDTLVLSLASDNETRKIYPFDFALNITFSVCENALNVKFSVQNTGKYELPYMLGWHPGFALDNCTDAPIGNFKLAMSGKNSLTWHPLMNGCFVNPVGVPYPIKDSAYHLCEEEIYSNDTMIFVGTGDEVTLTCDGCHGLKMSWSENLPYFCIWKQPRSDARFVCLEPWSDIPGDGATAENFNEKKMSRLPEGESEDYVYNMIFN